jgi:hypothetical protein
MGMMQRSVHGLALPCLQKSLPPEIWLVKYGGASGQYAGYLKFVRFIACALMQNPAQIESTIFSLAGNIPAMM